MQKWPVVKENIKYSQEFHYPLYWNWNMKAKSLKKLLVIIEICSWLQSLCPSNPGGSQEYISLITNNFCHHKSKVSRGLTMLIRLVISWPRFLRLIKAWQYSTEYSYATCCFTFGIVAMFATTPRLIFAFRSLLLLFTFLLHCMLLCYLLQKLLHVVCVWFFP